MTRRLRALTLEDAIYYTIRHGELDIDSLADHIGCGASMLYRAASMNDEAGLPLKKLIPVMKAQDSYGILEHMASRCDFLLIPQPKRRGRMAPSELADLQGKQAEAVKALTDFFAGQRNQDDTRKAIEVAMGSLARGRIAVNHGIKQEELAL